MVLRNVAGALCAAALLIAWPASRTVAASPPWLSTTSVPVSAEAVDTGACDGLLNPQEQALARLFEKDRDQRRPVRHCDPILTRVARARALDMATRGYFSHVTPDGNGPNIQVVRAGYALPRFYSSKRKANNIEVISAGDDTAAEAWSDWLHSRHHRRQVLGLERFFADQTDYGVGFADRPGSRYGRYWVLITARH